MKKKLIVKVVKINFAFDKLKRGSIAFLFLCLLVTCKKEVATIDSFTSFGRAYPMAGNQNIIGATKTPDDGYLIWGNTDAGTHGKQDGFLMRLNNDYKPIWYKTYGGFSNDYFESATFDGQGNILAGGTSTSFGVSLDSNSTLANPCMYAVYVNGNGELLWQKTFVGNPGAKNIANTLFKVLLLPNQNFALVGSTNNYLQQFGGTTYYALNAFIQCINNKGDTVWHSNYNYFDTIDPLPDFPIVYVASNAVLSPDGNIEMLMLRKANGSQYFPLSLINIASNSTSGTNKYISRNPLIGYANGAFYLGVLERPFFPMQLVDASSEKYIVAAQGEMILCNSGGTILKRVEINENSPVQDLLVSNGFAYFANNRYFVKTDLNGKFSWNSTAYDKQNIDVVKGIFIEKDNSLSVFCSYYNSLAEKDLALLRLNQNGQLILNK